MQFMFGLLINLEEHSHLYNVRWMEVHFLTVLFSLPFSGYLVILVQSEAVVWSGQIHSILEP